MDVAKAYADRNRIIGLIKKSWITCPNQQKIKNQKGKPPPKVKTEGPRLRRKRYEEQLAPHGAVGLQHHLLIVTVHGQIILQSMFSVPIVLRNT